MDSILDSLRDKGLKLTPRRQAIIKIFIDCNAHLTPEEVWNKLRAKFTRCGLPSVYRNLESLAECGILARIHKFDRKKHYGLCAQCRGRHHHHITCIECGKVEDIMDCALSGIKKIKGYKIISHFMQIDGVCASCLKQ